MPFEPVVEPPKRKLNPGLKFALELGPVALFFAVYKLVDVFAATAAMMVTVVVSLAVSYRLLGRVPIMPLVTAVMVIGFGSLTLFLKDQTFIQIKLTAIYLMFGGALAYGLAFGKPLLKIMFDEAFAIDDEGWRILTLRWMLFFFALAALNEVVRRVASYDAWVNFKTFGTLPLTLAFAMAQVGLISRHGAKDGGGGTAF